MRQKKKKQAGNNSSNLTPKILTQEEQPHTITETGARASIYSDEGRDGAVKAVKAGVCVCVGGGILKKKKKL